MSFQITTAFVQQYKDNVMLLVQQRGSVLRDTVVNDTQVGKNAFVDQIGSTAAIKRTSRHSDTPLISTPHARRRISLITYEWADLIDNDDKVRLLIDPESAYSQNAAWSMGRAMDDEIIAAALGTAFTGETGSTSTVLPSAQKIAAASAGLTLAKLRSARKILREGEVAEDEPRFIAVMAEQTDDLLGDTTVTSADFATVKALVEGSIRAFVGFEFRNTQRLTTDANSDRQVFAYARTGIQLNTGREPAARITERADKSYSTQVYYGMDIGATRLEEEKVVEIACVEA